MPKRQNRGRNRPHVVDSHRPGRLRMAKDRASLVRRTRQRRHHEEALATLKDAAVLVDRQKKTLSQESGILYRKMALAYLGRNDSGDLNLALQALNTSWERWTWTQQDDPLEMAKHYWIGARIAIADVRRVRSLELLNAFLRIRRELTPGHIEVASALYEKGRVLAELEAIDKVKKGECVEIPGFIERPAELVMLEAYHIYDGLSADSYYAYQGKVRCAWRMQTMMLEQERLHYGVTREPRSVAVERRANFIRDWKPKQD